MTRCNDLFHRIAAALLAVGLAGPALAESPANETPGERCSTAGGDREKAQCCEEAFNECLRACPTGQSGPNSACGSYCDQAVRQACLREATGKADSPGPKPPAPGGVVRETPPAVTRPGELGSRSEMPATPTD
jgi:hypothetical protein